MKRYEFKIKHYFLLVIVLLVILLIKNHVTYKIEVNDVLSYIKVDEIESIEVSVNDNWIYGNYSDKFTITNQDKIHQFVEVFDQMSWQKRSNSYSFSTNYSDYRFEIRGKTRYIHIDLIQNKFITMTTHTEAEGFRNYNLKGKWPETLGHDFFKFME